MWNKEKGQNKWKKKDFVSEYTLQKSLADES